MRVVYYAWPMGLDHVLPQVLALGRRVETHLIVETAPECKNTGVLGPMPDNLPAGVHPDAWPSLQGWLPDDLQQEIRDTVRLHRVVHDCPRAYHPRTMQTSIRAARFIQALDPGLVHFDETLTRSVWTFLALGRIPIVANVQDMESHPGDGASRIQLARRVAWRRVAHLIFHSRHCQDRYLQLPKLPRRPSTVIPFGVLGIFRRWERRSCPTEVQTVLFFGRLSSYKGLPTLLAAAPRIAEAVPGVRIVIAGSPVRDFVFPKLPTLPRGGEFERHVRYIPNDLLCELFQRATIVVLPYESATQSGVAMTAFAFGKPVVATAVGGIPEVVEDLRTGLLVPPGDPAALADATTRLLRDAPQRESLAQEIQSRSRTEFSWETHAERFVNVYRLATN